jgi:hypothetical protein
MLGLFDRPAQEKAIAALLKPPAIPGLTELLTDLSTTDSQRILAKLRRARLLAGEDPHSPGCLDTHPLVREYFGEQLRSQPSQAWKVCNRRLYYYYQKIAQPLPESFAEMEPLFLAVIFGCKCGTFREALHEVYIPRIQRGESCFAARVLGARGNLLLVLAHFFEDGRWGSFVEPAADDQKLTPEDKLFILMQSGQYLTATRGFGAREALICYKAVEALCQACSRVLIPPSAVLGLWRYSLVTDKLSETMRLAKQFFSLAKQHNDVSLTLGLIAP